MALTKTDKRDIGIMIRNEIRSMVDDEIARWMEKHYRRLYNRSNTWKKN